MLYKDNCSMDTKYVYESMLMIQIRLYKSDKLVTLTERAYCIQYVPSNCSYGNKRDIFSLKKLFCFPFSK